MATKRKKQSSDIPRKRAKGLKSKHHVEDQEYKIKTILDEKGDKYLIDWEDIDGERFSPTWEPKDFANEQAIADWTAQKAAKVAAAAAAAAATATPAPPKRKGRPRKVIESSPATVVADKSSAAKQQFPEVPDRQLDPVTDATYQTPLSGDASNSDTECQPLEIHESQPSPLSFPRVKAAVTVDAPPSSFVDGEYQEFSSSQHPEEPTEALDRLSPSQQLEDQPETLPEPATNGTRVEEATDTSKIIPDSQSLQELSTLQVVPVSSVQPDLNSKEQRTTTEPLEPVEQQNVQSPAPLQSTLSSFPFQTQISALRASSVPASSPLASVPSHSVGTFGDSAPPRPQTPSSPLSVSFPMATEQQSPNSSGSLAARLKALRERHRPGQNGTETPLPASPLVRLRAEAEGGRSPSAVPAIEPMEPISQEEMNTSERYETLMPRETDQTNHVNDSSNSIIADAQNERHPSLRAHTVPIALVGHQRDQYQATVYFHRDFIQRFLSESQPDSELSSQAEVFVEKMRCIALHPDLDNVETLTQYAVDPQTKAQWDIDSSAKFRFLKELLDATRDHSLHFVIVSNEGQIVHILETFLSGIKVPHRTLTSTESTSLDSDHSGLLVSIVSSDPAVRAELQPLPSPADLIIAMSPAVGDHEHIERLLEQDCLVLTLIVPGTVEHVDFSLSPLLSPQARLRALVSGIHQLSNEAGKLEESQFPIDRAAQEIAQHLQKAAETPDAEFPIIGMSTLRNLDSQTESDISSAGHKRPLDPDDSTNPNKRPRTAEVVEPELELPTTINPREIEITHISDSITKPTQSQPSSSSEAEKRLQQLLVEAQSKIDEHVAALSELQYRHEEQREQLIKVTNERDTALLAVQRAVARYTESAEATSKLKATRTLLQEQLDAANARLLNHDIPERAELEASKIAAYQAQAETLKLQERLDKVQGELEYTRSLYQSASQSASGLATQNTELDNNLKATQARASGEHVKLRQMGYDGQAQNLRADNQRLKALLRDRETALKFRDEEIARLKEANRGRMGTRGSSIPRSPRLGSPMKSRQGSPAAGELRGKGAHLHPLRQS